MNVRVRQIWSREGVCLCRVKRRTRRWHALPTRLLEGLVRSIEEHEVPLRKGELRVMLLWTLIRIQTPLGGC